MIDSHAFAMPNEGASSDPPASATLPPAILHQMSMRRIRLGVVLAVSILIALLLVSGPHLSDSQPATKIPRIGLLFVPSESFIAELVQVFRQGLRELGWVEGRTVAIESRYAEGQVDRLPRLAAELVALQVDVIVTADSPAINAAARATTTIPIVFAAAGDPVAAGHVSSLARPGGNITGLSLLATELSPKRLQLLKEAAPRATRLAILFNPQDPSMVRRVQEAQAAAQALGMATVPLPVRAPGDFEGAFAVMIREHADCLLTVVDGLTIRNSKRIVDFAAANRIPAAYEIRDFVERGGLLSYGPKPRENYRRAAAYVDKLLRGAKPADLPVEQPTVFELVINLKTAMALGLTIPLVGAAAGGSGDRVARARPTRPAPAISPRLLNSRQHPNRGCPCVGSGSPSF